MIFIIRTKLVYIENCDILAYRLKLAEGGIGVVVVNSEGDSSETAVLDRKTCKAIRNNKKNSFTDEFFIAAISKTKSLPYHVLPDIPFQKLALQKQDEIIPENIPCLKESVISQFDNFVDKYRDESGNFSRQLLNINLIQYFSRNKIAAGMISEKCSAEEVIDYILKTKAAAVARVIIPAGGYAKALIDMLNDLCGCDALQDLKKTINLRLARANGRN